MADKIKYMGINLPDSLVEELKVWKMAYSLSSGRNVSYAEMVQDMLGSLKVGNPSVVEAMDHLIQANPELKTKLSNPFESDKRCKESSK